MALVSLNPLTANFTKWSNTLKQFVGKFPTNCLSVFDHFVGLALKWPKPKPLGSYMANDKINLLVSMGKLMGTLIHFMPVLHFIKKPGF